MVFSLHVFFDYDGLPQDKGMAAEVACQQRGDWIEVEKLLGIVTDIYLRATKVRTRDNIEYLVPNSNLIEIGYFRSNPFKVVLPGFFAE